MEPAAPFNPPPFCPECGYALRGLPAAGRCPECGWGYGRELVLFESADVAAGRSGWWSVHALNAAFVVFLVVTLLMVTRWLQYDGFVQNLLVLLAVGAVGWVKSILSGRDLERGLWQARFSPAGFASRRGAGPARWVRWNDMQAVELKAVYPPDEGPARRHVLRVRRRVDSLWEADEALLRIEFDATAAEARAVHDRLIAWRHAAVGAVAGREGRMGEHG